MTVLNIANVSPYFKMLVCVEVLDELGNTDLHHFAVHTPQDDFDKIAKSLKTIHLTSERLGLDDATHFNALRKHFTTCMGAPEVSILKHYRTHSFDLLPSTETYGNGAVYLVGATGISPKFRESHSPSGTLLCGFYWV